ncbi:acyl carrier protein [Saccharomonospora saliphila]|uniref:acyl carrier protein n=1 Tax=Saccharomonospora saliphila TaxID=369829 RepID=UPI00035EF9F4|nr:acyl carrier protein [Saccharomonospora saliphila]
MTEQQQRSGTDTMVDQVRRLLVEGAGVDAADLAGGGDRSLVDLGVDSLAAMELQALVQKHHGVSLPEGSLRMSVPEIAAHIESRVVGGE